MKRGTWLAINIVPPLVALPVVLSGAAADVYPWKNLAVLFVWVAASIIGHQYVKFQQSQADLCNCGRTGNGQKHLPACNVWKYCTCRSVSTELGDSWNEDGCSVHDPHYVPPYLYI